MTSPTEQAGRPLALVTGASSGIGYELAKQFVEHGYDVVATAHDDAITAAAESLQQGEALVHPVQANLNSAEGVESLVAAVEALGRPVDAAALNAGFGLGGAFVETDLAREVEMIQVNVTAVVHLAKRLLPAMVARDEGKLLITSSIAATMPGPYQAVYNATKAFLRSFSEALQHELSDSQVTVTALMPGPTDTEFFEVAELEDTRIGQMKKDDPAQVAKQGFNAMQKGKDFKVAGSLKTKVQGRGDKLLPEGLKAKAHVAMAEPGGAE